MGVNPDSDDENSGGNYVDTSFLQFKKYFQRVLYRTDLDYIKFINEVKIRSHPTTSNHLVVAGHSLDITDEDIIKEVFAVADTITIICYNENAISDSINNLVKIYEKKGFDLLRSRTGLEFKLYSDYNTY